MLEVIVDEAIGKAAKHGHLQAFQWLQRYRPHA